MESLKKIQDHYVLMKGHHPAMCPYATRLLVPGKLQGTADLNQVSCTSGCALFSLKLSTKELIADVVSQDHADVSLCSGKVYSDLPIIEEKSANLHKLSL
jgi:hypothetical protein